MYRSYKFSSYKVDSGNNFFRKLRFIFQVHVDYEEQKHVSIFYEPLSITQLAFISGDIAIKSYLIINYVVQGCKISEPNYSNCYELIN